MIGPTGCGKTEISRRLARLADAPFVKVEATKFTEVGYVGRDVEQIARDLAEEAIRLEKDRRREAVRDAASKAAMDRLLKALVGDGASEATPRKLPPAAERRRDERCRGGNRGGGCTRRPDGDPGLGGNVGMINLSDMMGKAFGRQPLKRRKMRVADAWDKLVDEESEKRMDQDDVARVALQNAETNGIVFIDEIDKIAVSDVRGGSVSREGVQRDLLPLIEGTTVATKYGPMKTDHVLFIASGAFHVAKPSDMLPELQGRLPIRVELKALSEDDFVRILAETRANLVEQYRACSAPSRSRWISRPRPCARLPARRASERKRREHRRPPLADGDGKAAGGSELRCRGSRGHHGDRGRSLCVGPPGGLAGNADLSKYIL
jgi:ATP-dependent HslUV protease ATP-binding subunit HslU